MPVSRWWGQARDLVTDPEMLGVWALSSLALFVVSLLAVPWLVCRLPEDYLHPGSASIRPGLGRRVVRNTLGVLLLLAGVAMLVLPGQGLLTILLGLTLLDFPKKRQLLARLLRRPKLLSLINSMRKRFGRPPLTNGPA